MDTTSPTRKFDPGAPAVQSFLQNLNTGWKMQLFFWQRLPSLIFWGVRIRRADLQRCEVSLPFGWRTQNPFKSIYFAAQCGAAELSTGMLASLAIQGRGRISMLITGVEAEFIKKADALTTFVCDEGAAFHEAIDRAIETGEGQTVTVSSTGMLPNGQIVSRMRFQWSFKVKG